jgi:iron complex transport system ATP-binding protein
MSDLLSAQRVTAVLGGATVVERASLALRGGELAVLVGPNGAGKTTLLRALAGLIPAGGAIALAGRPLGSLKPRERARGIAYLPQGHVFHWPMPVAAIVMLGREPHADPFSGTSAEDRAAVARALATTETDGFAERAVTTLSGGERARVALARALATQAPVLLADEPTASLDPRHQLVVMELLRQAARGGNAILATMHDLTLAARFADRVIVMHQGRLVAEGTPAEALSPERLADVFGVEAQVVDLGGARIPVPLRPLNPHPEEPA